MHPIYAKNLKDLAPAPDITDIGILTNIIVKNAFTIAGIVALIILIFGGFQFISGAGSGDAKKMESGKNALTAAVVGLVLVFGSFLIVKIIEILTGTTLLGQ